MFQAHEGKSSSIHKNSCHFFEKICEPNALLYNIPEHLNPDQKDNSASHHLQNNTYSLPLQCLVPEASNGKTINNRVLRDFRWLHFQTIKKKTLEMLQ